MILERNKYTTDKHKGRNWENMKRQVCYYY